VLGLAERRSRRAAGGIGAARRNTSDRRAGSACTTPATLGIGVSRKELTVV